MPFIRIALRKSVLAPLTPPQRDTLLAHLVDSLCLSLGVNPPNSLPRTYDEAQWRSGAAPFGGCLVEDGEDLAPSSSNEAKAESTTTSAEESSNNAIACLRLIVNSSENLTEGDDLVTTICSRLSDTLKTELHLTDDQQQKQI